MKTTHKVCLGLVLLIQTFANANAIDIYNEDGDIEQFQVNRGHRKSVDTENPCEGATVQVTVTIDPNTPNDTEYAASNEGSSDSDAYAARRWRRSVDDQGETVALRTVVALQVLLEKLEFVDEIKGELAELAQRNGCDRRPVARY